MLFLLQTKSMFIVQMHCSDICALKSHPCTSISPQMATETSGWDYGIIAPVLLCSMRETECPKKSGGSHLRCFTQDLKLCCKYNEMPKIFKNSFFLSNLLQKEKKKKEINFLKHASDNQEWEGEEKKKKLAPCRAFLLTAMRQYCTFS